MLTQEVKSSVSDASSLLGIVHKLGDWLIALLQLYILINSGVVGLILGTERHWGIVQTAGVTLVYTLAMSVNCVWMYRLHQWLREIVGLIGKSATETEALPFNNPIRRIVASVLDDEWWNMLFAFHIISDVVVVLCILLLTDNQKWRQLIPIARWIFGY